MKKYLLLVEDEKLWEQFKDKITLDINSEIISMIKERVSKTGAVHGRKNSNDK
mgnify:FL=1